MPKYCDHGAYIPDATITASFATNVMTVTATTQQIALGMIVTGVGIPANTVLLSFGTGTGGAGTYNLSTSPGTLSSRTVTGSGGTYANIPPTFGVPQDGDGVGIDPSTAAATVSIDLTSATAAAGATISIAGATLTCVASGATVAQFNAGSGATLAANIAAAINRTTNTATIAAPATGWTVLQIWAACYARVVGNTLQIMFRAGSATHNGLQVVTAGFTGGTFGPYSFSGGVSGCWGMLLYWATPSFGAAAGALGAYGLWGSVGPIAGTFDANDLIYIRSGKTVITSTSAGTVGSFVGNSTAAAPVRMVFDTNKVWTGDSPTAHFNIISIFSTAAAVGVRLPFASIESTQFSPTDYGLTFTHTGSAAVSWDVGGGCCLSGVSLLMTGSGTLGYQHGANPAAGRRTAFSNFYFSTPKTSTTLLALGASSVGNAEIGPGIVDASGSSTAATGVVSCASSGNEAVVRNVKFRNFVIGSRLNSTTLPNSGTRITYTDCDFGNISHRGPYMAQGVPTYDFSGFITSYSNKGSRDFFHDTQKGFCQWNSVYAQPTLNATLDNGVDKWSIVVVPSAISGACSPLFPFSLPRFSVINALPTGPRTFTVEIAVSDQVTWTKRDVSLVVSYTTDAGDDVVLSSFDLNAGALTTSTATWSSESGGKVLYVDSGTLLHNKFKIQLSTPDGKDLPLGAEVTATVRVHTTVANTTQYLFVDPEILVA